MSDAAYHFLSFVRDGFAGALTQPDTFGSAQPATATTQFSVSVSGVADPVTRTLSVRGPGDVIGIPPAQVVRTDPIEGAVGVEPNYFAQIEYDRPDLPWLFTPARHVGERLRPWLVLVVLDATGENACTVTPGTPLPYLDVSAGATAMLPDLTTSYLWAHAQLITPQSQSLVDAVHGDPRLSVSRLLCPRHLSPNTWYVAAVVPAFATGRLAGLGQPVTAADEAALEPAWKPGQPVKLPVYHSWRFRTGEDADFEALARKLTGRPLPANVGTRAMDVGRPGAGLPASAPPTDVQDTRTIEWLDGALRPLDAVSPARDPAATHAFQTSLTVLLDRPADLLAAADHDPVVAPPIYGDHHALVFRLDAAAPPWLAELNLDARTRVAASLGSQVLAEHQEDFVARAWRQLGDVLAANRLLQCAQFARTAGSRVHGRLATMDPATALAVTSPAHARLSGVVAPGVTIGKTVHASRLPDVTVQPAYRRLARPGAAPARAARVSILAASGIERFATEAFRAPVDGPDGSTTMRAASHVLGASKAQAVLTDLGGTAGGNADTVVATLNDHRAPLPDPAVIGGLNRRTDTGVIAVLSSLGAVPATAIYALLAAAAPPPPVPPPPHPPSSPVFPHPPLGPAHLPAHLPTPILPDPPLGPVHPLAPVISPDHVAVLPHGLAGPEGGAVNVVAAGQVFERPGVNKRLDGLAVLAGGTVTVDSALVAAINSQSTPVKTLDGPTWAALQSTAQLPRRVATADPVTDPGSRLDVIRTDAASIEALSRVAAGDLAASVDLDRTIGATVTTGAAGATLTALISGTFAPVLPPRAAAATGPLDVSATAELLSAAARALSAMVSMADAPAPADGPLLNLTVAKAGLLSRIDPAVTIPARTWARITSLVRTGAKPRDDLDPVMACPQFNDAMWQAVRDLGQAWLIPGLDNVPPDTVTLVRTNPSFVAAFLVGLNHELMRELLWREYPTDQRGTAFHRFWGRTGPSPDDIGPVHLFHDHLTDNLKTGPGAEAVLLLRSELLRRYPGSIIYLSRATQSGGQLNLDDNTIKLPVFRGDLPPDVTFVGFPITPDELRAPGDPWYFVIAQPPTEPRFGLDDPTNTTPAVPTTANDLAWSHMSPDGNSAAFAVADPPALRNHPLDTPSVHWGDSAAVQARLTYQHPVRVAIRAADLLPPTPPPPAGPPP